LFVYGRWKGHDKKGERVWLDKLGQAHLSGELGQVSLGGSQACWWTQSWYNWFPHQMVANQQNHPLPPLPHPHCYYSPWWADQGHLIKCLTLGGRHLCLWCAIAAALSTAWCCSVATLYFWTLKPSDTSVSIGLIRN
jgi:hypothetical protein